MHSKNIAGEDPGQLEVMLSCPLALDAANLEQAFLGKGLPGLLVNGVGADHTIGFSVSVNSNSEVQLMECTLDVSSIV